MKTIIDFNGKPVDAYSKDEVIAMLTELVKEMNLIKECEYQIYGTESWNFAGKCQDVIQQKINALKENKKWK